jgi:hypothetical protein
MNKIKQNNLSHSIFNDNNQLIAKAGKIMHEIIVFQKNLEYI